jgi:hypothetical protein
VDDLDGGVGDDTIKGRGDGKAADNIVCGDGIDTVRADRNDVVPSDGSCETVERTAANAKGPKSG